MNWPPPVTILGVFFLLLSCTMMCQQLGALLQPLFLNHFLLPTGTLHVGDEIREINGISVANQTVEQLQKMLVSQTLLRLSVHPQHSFISVNMY